MNIDVKNLNLNTLTIDGYAKFDDSDPTATFNIVARNIWVRGGVLAAGSPTKPFPASLNIQLLGLKNDSNYVIIDPFVEAGNKVIAVTGHL
jgi:hypothetical protein